MRKWDERLLEFEWRPNFYKRYIDDGFGIWLHGVESLCAFAAHANAIHPNIKVELRWSRQRIEFLDTWVALEHGTIYTDLYIKPTDRQLYIHNSSCHPAHTKKGLAYSLGLRMKRICEKESDYRKHRKDLKMQLRKRGYSGKHIEKQLQRADAADRGHLLSNSKRKTQQKRVPLVVTYSKLLPDIRAILNKHERTLHRSERMQKVFPESPLLAYRRDRNICDVLVHTKTNRALQATRKSCTCDMCSLLYRPQLWPIGETIGTK
jgi:hypothetical protein